MAYIKFKEPIDVADDLKVNGTSLGSNAFTSTTIPTNNNQLSNGAGYITLAEVPANPTVNNSKITLSAGDGLSNGGDFTLNQSSAETITFNVDGTVVRTSGNQTIGGTKTFNTTTNGTLWAGDQSGYTSTNRNFFVNNNGVPSNNLGTPTVQEMALFDDQFNNKTAFINPLAVEFLLLTVQVCGK